MTLGRLLAYILLAASLIVAGYDILTSLEAWGVTMSSVGELWFRLSSGSLNATQAFIQRYIWADLWDPALVWVLRLPALPVLFGLATIALILTRPPKRKRIFG